MVFSQIKLCNETLSDITAIAVSDVDINNFWLGDGSPLDFDCTAVPKGASSTLTAEMNLYAKFCLFKMKLIFDDGSHDEFRINQWFASYDERDVLTEAEKPLTNAIKEKYCICTRTNGSDICPELEIYGNKCHDIQFFREVTDKTRLCTALSTVEGDMEGGSSIGVSVLHTLVWHECFALKIVIKDTKATLNLIESKQKGREAQIKHDHDLDFDAAIDLLKAAIEKLKDVDTKEAKKLRATYMATLKKWESEIQSMKSSLESLEEARKRHEELEALLNSLDLNNSKNDNLKDDNQGLLFLKNAMEQYIRGLELFNAAVQAVDNILQGVGHDNENIVDNIEKFKESNQLLKECIKTFRLVGKYLKNYDEFIRQAQQRIKTNDSLIATLTSLQLLVEAGSLTFKDVSSENKWDGDELTDVPSPARAIRR